MSSVQETDRYSHVEHLIDGLLGVLGFDSTDEDLVGTPKRVAGFWREFLEYDPGNIKVTFESVYSDQMVVVRGITAYSLCSHHLLPMVLKVHVGYIPKAPPEGKLIGLSKIPRIVQKHAHTLQLQERLAQSIVDELQAAADPLGVAVVIEGEHMCMSMRGIRSPGTMITSLMSGAFRNVEERAREEFLSLIKEV